MLDPQKNIPIFPAVGDVQKQSYKGLQMQWTFFGMSLFKWQKCSIKIEIP